MSPSDPSEDLGEPDLTRREFSRRLAGTALTATLTGTTPEAATAGEDAAQPFGAEFPALDSLATGPWWTKKPRGQGPPPSLDVPRDQVVAFALYTQDRGVLKMTAQ